jgi:hypothetical protein
MFARTVGKYSSLQSSNIIGRHIVKIQENNIGMVHMRRRRKKAFQLARAVSFAD